MMGQFYSDAKNPARAVCAVPGQLPHIISVVLRQMVVRLRCATDLLFFRYFAMIEDTRLVDGRIGRTQMGDYKLVGIGDIPQA